MTDSHVPSGGESERESVEQDDATVDSDELTKMHLAAAASTASSSSPKDSRQASPTPAQQPSYCTPALHGFIFAFHRKTVRYVYIVQDQPAYSMSVILRAERKGILLDLPIMNVGKKIFFVYM